MLLFALPTHEIFKIVPFGGLIVIDVVLLAAPAASAGNRFSAGLENLFNLNRISHNWEQYSTASENCKHYFKKIKKSFFYFFLDFTLWAPARCRVKSQAHSAHDSKNLHQHRSSASASTSSKPFGTVTSATHESACNSKTSSQVTLSLITEISISDPQKKASINFNFFSFLSRV